MDIGRAAPRRCAMRPFENLENIYQETNDLATYNAVDRGTNGCLEPRAQLRERSAGGQRTACAGDAYINAWMHAPWLQYQARHSRGIRPGDGPSGRSDPETERAYNHPPACVGEAEKWARRGVCGMRWDAGATHIGSARRPSRPRRIKTDVAYDISDYQ